MGVRIGIAGGQGQMGRAVAAILEGRDDASLAFTFDREDPLPELSAADVVIDFTSAAASAELARRAAQQGGVALVIGSTGFDAALDALVQMAAKRIPIVRSGNFSLGVNVLVGLAEQAARVLGPEDYDVEVFEAHHRRKVDAPSGTALMLGDSVARGRGVPLHSVEVRTRDGLTGPRPPGAVGFSVMRGGGIVGEHSLVFAAEDEILTLSHSARDRGLFARGALRAALWAAGKPAGLYDMQQVLGFQPLRAFDVVNGVFTGLR